MVRRSHQIRSTSESRIRRSQRVQQRQPMTGSNQDELQHEIARLREELMQEQQRHKEEQRRYKEEQRRYKEEQRQREEDYELEERQRKKAETMIQFQTLENFLQASHSLSLDLKIITDLSLTTQGDVTKPAGRLYPQRILLWNDFPQQQEEIWNRLAKSSDFYTQHLFPSKHQMEYIKTVIAPISCENSLRNYERETVENAVTKLVDAVYNDKVLRDELGLQGTVSFESHTNMGSFSNHHDFDKGKQQAQSQQHKFKKVTKKGNADQFCIYRKINGNDHPALAIEYKAPHKLTRDEIITGLQCEIQPEKDIINKDGENFGFASKSLCAAVITQLFSYMINKGLQYGYICTGEVFIFLFIPDDPTVVYFFKSVPNLDVKESDEIWIHRTAVAQVFTFILRALAAKPPGQSWYEKTSNLDIWEMEYIDILKNIPETIRKSYSPSPYKPLRWLPFNRSPIKTRLSSKFLDVVISKDNDDDNDNNDGIANIPLLSPSAYRIDSSHKTNSIPKNQPVAPTPRRIEQQPFCTSKCLKSLVNGKEMDMTCLNYNAHRQKHLNIIEFLYLIRTQLAQDRGPDADCIPLHLSGSRGSLFKVRLSSHGYTLVAKGMEDQHRHHLENEKKIYENLITIQGIHVPVCLGISDLEKPYYYDSKMYVSFLFLSWAGYPLFRCISNVNKVDLKEKAITAFRALHQSNVLHRDAQLRNMVYDKDKGHLMIIDFERAEFRGRRILETSDLNQISEKKIRDGNKVITRNDPDDFAQELSSIIACIRRARF